MRPLRKIKKRLLAILLALAAATTTSASSPDESPRNFAAVARHHLRQGQVNEALVALGEAADLGWPSAAGTDDELAIAAAGLYRRLRALNADERYALLRRWSMPTEARRTVRVLTSITPTDAPPSVFARALEIQHLASCGVAPPWQRPVNRIDVPIVESVPPTAGKRVRYRLEGDEHSDIYSILNLPEDWKPGEKFPLIVEYPGNIFSPRVAMFLDDRPSTQRLRRWYWDLVRPDGIPDEPQPKR